MAHASPSLLFTAACSLAIATAPAQAAFVSIGDMLAGQWQQTVIRSNAISTVTTSVQANPNQAGDSEWRTVQDVPQTFAPFNVADAVANIFLGAEWSPTSDGAIDQMQILFDARGVSSRFANNVSGFFRAVIEQDGGFYSLRNGSATIFGTGVESTLSWTFDELTAWNSLIGGVSGTKAPDFSAAGATIRFGYLYSITVSCIGAQGCLPSGGDTAIDNLVVNVTALPANGVPEPGALSLAALALCGIARRHRPAASQRQGVSVKTVSTPV